MGPIDYLLYLVDHPFSLLLLLVLVGGILWYLFGYLPSSWDRG